MGSPKTTRVMKGRPLPNIVENVKKNIDKKLQPKYTEIVLEMQENVDLQRIRTAPKAIVVQPPMQNLMFDFCVHRGSPYAKNKPELEALPPKPKPPKVQPRTPTPELVVLDCYLKALPNSRREDPDPPLPKRPIPPFIPWPTNPMKETQIWPNDLFWFDSDVEPMVEQLVGQCLEQGYMEAQESLQVEAKRAQHESFEFIKIAELDCWQRMHLAEIRVEEEKQRRMKQEIIITEQEEILKIKVESQRFARTYLKQLKGNVIDICLRSMMFFDPLEEELKSKYFPNLLKGMAIEYDEIIKYRQTTCLLVDETMEPLDYTERVEDEMTITLARLRAILDSWISFEDNVIVELEIAELASQRIMQGAVGEVGLVTSTFEILLDNIFA